MRIPHSLPQFKKTAALFLVSGHFEAHFYLAKNGRVEDQRAIRHIPREEIIGKDWCLRGNSKRATPFGTVSSAGTRKLNLRKRFWMEVGSVVNDMVRYDAVGRIYLFAPSPVLMQLMQHLSPSARAIVHLNIKGEYTKRNPIDIVRMATQGRQ